MAANIFDTYVMVDWSGASTPRLGKDSIWYCVIERHLSNTTSSRYQLPAAEQKERSISATSHISERCVRNVATRAQAEADIRQLALSFVDRCQLPESQGKLEGRLLIGFDFSLAFPQGFCEALGLAEVDSCYIHERQSKEHNASGGARLQARARARGDGGEQETTALKETKRKRMSDRSNGSRLLRSVNVGEADSCAPSGSISNLEERHLFMSPEPGLVAPAESSAKKGCVQTAGCKAWRRVWDFLASTIHDGDHNENNRFHAAAAMNKKVSQGPHPFWSCPPSQAGQFLSAKKRPPPRSQSEARKGALQDRRLTEALCGAQSTWKLFTPGSVGSQALLGIPRVRAIRDHPQLRDHTRVWPFETGLRPPGGAHARGQDVPLDCEPRIVIAEVYPSLVPPDCRPGEPLDAGQVRALALHFAELDSEGLLGELFWGPLLPRERRQAVAQATPSWRRNVRLAKAWTMRAARNAGRPSIEVEKALADESAVAGSGADTTGCDAAERATLGSGPQEAAEKDASRGVLEGGCRFGSLEEVVVVEEEGWILGVL